MLFRNFRNKLSLALTALVASLATTAPAFASGGIDVSTVTSAIDGAKAPIASIGAAVLVVLVGVKVYKWIRRAL